MQNAFLILFLELYIFNVPSVFSILYSIAMCLEEKECPREYIYKVLFATFLITLLNNLYITFSNSDQDKY